MEHNIQLFGGCANPVCLSVVLMYSVGWSVIVQPSFTLCHVQGLPAPFTQMQMSVRTTAVTRGDARTENASASQDSMVMTAALLHASLTAITMGSV